jgi:hypothetical protein
MKILVIHLIAGRLDQLAALIVQVRDTLLGAVFVLGNVVHLQRDAEPSAPVPSAEQTYGAALALLGSLHVPIYLIPRSPRPAARHDRPGGAGLSRVSRDPSRPPHGGPPRPGRCRGRLRRAADAGRGADRSTVHFPAWEARIAFEHLHGYSDLFRRAACRLLLFATPPQAA